MNDFVPAPNIGRNPELYERENEALARDGRLETALRGIADWAGTRLVDIGCGTGFWLPRYADARTVVGVEPDPALLVRARERVDSLGSVSAVAGSAETLPLPDASADVVHARFAYFFGPGAERGLAEVRRILSPQGVFVAIDNSWRGGDFADLLRDAVGGNASMDPEATARWWAERGAERIEVEGGWIARDAAELEAVLRIEFPAETIDRWIQRNPGRKALSYRFALFVVR